MQGRLTIDPWLPEHWSAIRMNFLFQGRLLRLTATREGTRVERLSGDELLLVLAGKEVAV
jgi:trehalose/maltose hydrolase-like predicted phosphorylase